MDEPVWPEIVRDETVPPGVIVFVDPDGTRHPMPLVEFGMDPEEMT